MLSIAINAYSVPINYEFSLRIDGYSDKSDDFCLDIDDRITGSFVLDSEFFTPNGEDDYKGISDTNIYGTTSFNHYIMNSNSQLSFLSFWDIDSNVEIDINNMTFSFAGCEEDPTPNFYYFGTVEYFVDPPIATPEPASVFLVGLGLISFLKKRRRL